MTYSTEDLERMENIFSGAPIVYDQEEVIDGIECVILKDLYVHLDIENSVKEHYKKVAIPVHNEGFGHDLIEDRIDKAINAHHERGWEVPDFPMLISIIGRINQEETDCRLDGKGAEADTYNQILTSDNSPFNMRRKLGCNTIIDYDGGKVIHNPHAADMPDNITCWQQCDPERRVEYEFNPITMLADGSYGEMSDGTKSFVQHLSGFNANRLDLLRANLGFEDNVFAHDFNNYYDLRSQVGVKLGTVVPWIDMLGEQMFFRAHGGLNEDMRLPFYKVLEK